MPSKYDVFIRRIDDGKKKQYSIKVLRIINTIVAKIQLGPVGSHWWWYI